MRSRPNAVNRARRLRFERMVDRVISRLDPAVRNAMVNVAIVVEDRPQNGATDQFGVYEGIPLSERTNYNFAVPDRIVVYRSPLEEAYPNRADLEEQIRVTVLHEIGHHLGLEEDQLENIGLG